MPKIRLPIILLTVILLYPINTTFAKTESTEAIAKAVSGLKWRGVGPALMGGRIADIAVSPTEKSTWYVAVGSGGLWKTTNRGTTWTPIFDTQKSYSIGTVTIDPNNSDVIWVGTGEGNPRNSLNGGFGVYKSLDGGKTWMTMGLEKTRHIHRIKIDPTDPNTVYVGAIGSPWGEHAERGVYKTTDGGVTWEKILFVNNKTGVADLIIDPTNPNKLIAAMWEHKRDPWFFKSGGEGSGLYMTHDGGENWKKLTEEDGLPAGDLGRIGVAIAHGKPDVIYALVEAKRLEDQSKVLADAAKNWINLHGPCPSEDGSKKYGAIVSGGRKSLDREAVKRALGVKDLSGFQKVGKEITSFRWTNR